MSSLQGLKITEFPKRRGKDAFERRKDQKEGNRDKRAQSIVSTAAADSTQHKLQSSAGHAPV